MTDPHTRRGRRYYFTDHDLTPFGDVVFDVGRTSTQATDDRGPATTTLLKPTVGLMKVF